MNCVKQLKQELKALGWKLSQKELMRLFCMLKGNNHLSRVLSLVITDKEVITIIKRSTKYGKRPVKKSALKSASTKA